ncbi:MAG: LAGLIDADG family homing endonuclease [Minisyncoccia bacterium]
MNTKAHLKRAGRLGGIARILKYGNPGTAEGRSRGGRNSIQTHRTSNTGFNLLRKIDFPPESVELAELLGIFMGDGHVGEYQASVTTNSETDSAHAFFVQRLIRKLFDIPVRLRRRTDVKACELIISSKEVCDFFRTQGMTQNKVRYGVRIPAWIQGDDAYVRAFIRGLFDTDGCVFLDTHRINGRTYKHMGIAFTNRTRALLDFFRIALEAQKLHPTQKTKFTVFLRREEEIRRYFKEIGTSNPKHRRRYSEFLRIRKGGVA